MKAHAKARAHARAHARARAKAQDEDDSFKGIDWLINRIQSGFYRQLTALRKFGPISDIYITREVEENRFMLVMGYQAVHLTHLR